MIKRIIIATLLICAFAVRCERGTTENRNFDLTPTETIYLPTISSGSNCCIGIGDNHSAILDGDENLHVWGEIRNDTIHNACRFIVLVDVFDNEDKKIGRDYGKTYLNSIPASSRDCFHLIVPNSERWSRYKLDFSPSSVCTPATTTTVYSSTGVYNPDNSQYVISGIADIIDEEFVGVSASLYDESGNVCGCNFANIDGRGGVSIIFQGNFYSRTIDYKLTPGIHTAW
jgi:hypothetical protein